MAPVSNVHHEDPVPLDEVGLLDEAFSVMVALADFVLSAWLVAWIVTVVWLETEDGAV